MNKIVVSILSLIITVLAIGNMYLPLTSMRMCIDASRGGIPFIIFEIDQVEAAFITAITITTSVMFMFFGIFCLLFFYTRLKK